jgi:hypothetical protein
MSQRAVRYIIDRWVIKLHNARVSLSHDVEEENAAIFWG